MNISKSAFKNRRIVFLIPLGRIAPSGVRRVQDYKPYLTNTGWVYKIISYDSPLLYRIRQYGARFKKSVIKLAFKVNFKYWLYIPLMPFAVIFLILGPIVLFILKLMSMCYRAYVMISLLIKSIFADVVLLQQITPPIWFTKLLRMFNPKIVFDVDDAVFLLRPFQTIAVLRAAEVAASGSHYNQEYCLLYCKKVVFLPTPVPLEKFISEGKPAKRPKNNVVRIGWVGSPSTAKYLDVIAGPFRELVTRYPNRLKLIIVGLGPAIHLPPDIIEQKEHIEIIPWVEPDAVPQVVASFDIGIMPLHDTEWEKGKCGLKALEYMAAGVPVICSGVGENTYIVSDGSNGYLANTSAEWVAKIETLMDDPELRLKLGQAGKKTIQERYSTKHCFEILSVSILEPLVSTK